MKGDYREIPLHLSKNKQRIKPIRRFWQASNYEVVFRSVNTWRSGETETSHDGWQALIKRNWTFWNPWEGFHFNKFVAKDLSTKSFLDLFDLEDHKGCHLFFFLQASNVFWVRQSLSMVLRHFPGPRIERLRSFSGRTKTGLTGHSAPDDIEIVQKLKSHF